MDDLIEGYRRFRATTWPGERAEFEALASKGQRPRTLLIACSDSRVDPQMIFNARPGELFVVRNVANLVPTYQPDAAYHGTSAAIEFAVRALKVEKIVVCGHALCGGVRALLSGDAAGCDDFVSKWVSMAEPALGTVCAIEHASEEDRQRCGEFEAIKVSLNNLMTFPWLAERVNAGTLKLHGCWFAVATGELLHLGDDGEFAPVAPDPR
jgi:carbonic anhydrase